MKRIVLLTAVNIAVLAAISIIVEFLGLDRYPAARGLSLTGALIGAQSPGDHQWRC